MKNVPYIVACILGIFLFKAMLIDPVVAKPLSSKDIWRTTASIPTTKE